MTELAHLRDVFDLLKRGRHLSPEDEPAFSALTANYEGYAEYFAALGLKLVRHEREFFYFEPDQAEKVPETLPRIAVFAYILVDHAANQGRPLEEILLGQSFLISSLPHFTLDRYRALLRQVDLEDASDLRLVLNQLERYGWLKWLSQDEFLLLRPFHRVFDQCLLLADEHRAAEEAAGLRAPPEPSPASLVPPGRPEREDPA